MITLFEHISKILEPSTYISESKKVLSDDSLRYILGVHWLGGIEPNRAKEYVKKYHITKENHRQKIISMVKQRMAPIIKQSEEVIPRSKWDLDSLVGETELQLMNPHYYEAANKMLDRKPKHPILTLFQCSAIKPYYENKNWSKLYMDWAHEWSDAACISNPGIVLWDYSDKYPYRYDEWSIPAEKTLKEILNMTHKYRIVNMCRFIRMMRKLKYEHVFVMIPNPMKDWIFEQIIKHDIDGLGDKIKLVITEQIRKEAKKGNEHMGGLVNSRIGGWGGPKKHYISLLRKYAKPKDKDHFDEVTKEQLAKVNHKNEALEMGDMWDEIFEREYITESVKRPEYKIKDITASEVLKTFKNSDTIQKRMEDKGRVDKGENRLFYKSYYWSLLDIILYVLDGNLVEDIDKLYWDLKDVIDNDKEFECFGDFLYYYKPLCEVDEVDDKDFEKEAFKIKLLRPKPKLDLSFLD